MGDHVHAKHWGTGRRVKANEIPSWRSVPSGKPPFERTACGSYVALRHISGTHKGVTCRACRRSSRWLEAKDDSR